MAPTPDPNLTPHNEHTESNEMPEGFQSRVMAFERKLINEALSISDNHQGKAADYLDLTYHQFRGLMRKHGLKK